MAGLREDPLWRPDAQAEKEMRRGELVYTFAFTPPVNIENVDALRDELRALTKELKRYNDRRWPSGDLSAFDAIREQAR